MSNLIIFDVDDTIINGQSQKHLLKYLYKHGYVKFSFYIKILLWFVLYKLAILRSPQEIMIYAYSFAGGRSVEWLRGVLNDFYKEVLHNMIRECIVSIIEQHKANGDSIVLVSNSIYPLVDILKNDLKLHYVFATRLEEEGSVYTGNIEGEIMYGKNKMTCINEFLKQKSNIFEKIYVYTDHISDIGLLEMAHVPVAVSPDKKLSSICRKRGWQIINIK